ncbi:MAG: amidohydrolase family protein [Bacteroidia bacterium]|nr:amidohydrolase family protein [Bacteroidia bacterium]
MRQFSADYIFPISSPPIKNGVVTVNEDGVIVDISEYSNTQHSASNIQKLNGIICPGFVNAHCHLELSHLKNKVSEHKGMTGFISELIEKRNNFSKEEIQKSIEVAEQQMICNGIVAVGDISNNNSTFKQKTKENLSYYTFIEIFSLDPSKATMVYENGLNLQKELSQFNNQSNSSSLSPHAPYTMSVDLLKLINKNVKQHSSIITIHNQESKEESELFESNSGAMYDTFKAMGITIDWMRKTGKNSLQSTLPYLKDASKILLVHNTFTTEKDVDFLKSEIPDFQSKIFFCTCPNANMYIENTLPNYDVLIGSGCAITIGTDSLASNWNLSILDELKTISKHNPSIDLNTLLTWATKNGADFLNLNQLGTIEKGKKPGLNLLKNCADGKLNEETKLLKLI